MSLRMRGLRMARDPYVMVVVYSQIGFAYLWDFTIIGTIPTPYQLVGAVLIAGGSTAAVVLRYRAEAAEA